MSLDISESQMIERFVDGLKSSASAANEITHSVHEKKPKVFVKFVDGLKVAAGSCHQLAHAQQNHQWLAMRDLLEIIIENGQHLGIFNTSANPIWIKIEESLKSLIETGTTIATSKAISRTDLLAGIDAREKQAQIKLLNETIH